MKAISTNIFINGYEDSEKTNMCKFLEEKTMALSMDIDTQIDILEQNLKKMERIHQNKFYDSPVHKIVYPCNHKSSNLAQVAYLYDYDGEKMCHGVCSQTNCNRMYAHPPVYKRYENWNHSQSVIFQISNYEDFQLDVSEAKKIIKQLDREHGYNYFASKCTIWWKDFCKPEGDTVIYLDNTDFNGEWLCNNNGMWKYNSLSNIYQHCNDNVYTIKDKRAICIIPNKLNLCITKISSCVCQMCVLDTLECHCNTCVQNEFMFKKLPTLDCFYLNDWIKKLMYFLRVSKNVDFCCCNFHICMYNKETCECQLCSFQIHGCVCVRCSAFFSPNLYFESINICAHGKPENSCREDIVKLWLNHSYNELFRHEYQVFAEHTYKINQFIHKKQKVIYWKATSKLSHYTLHDIERNRMRWQLSTKTVFKDMM